MVSTLRVSQRGVRFAVLIALAVLPLAVSGVVEAREPINDELARDLAMDALADGLDGLGLAAADVSDVAIVGQAPGRKTGVTHLWLQQRYGGIEVHNAIQSVAVSAQGTVRLSDSRFVSDLKSKVTNDRVAIGVEQALRAAADELGYPASNAISVVEAESGADRRGVLSAPELSAQAVPHRLVYQRLSDGTLRLAWELTLDALDQKNWWQVRVDAKSGELLDKNDLIAHEQYEVYPIPLESPNHTSPLPPSDAREVEVDPYTDSAASPFGWHDTDGDIDPDFTITRGNNVHAYADTDANNVPDGGGNAEPDGGAGLDFTGATVAIDLTMDPSVYTQAAIANLFYWSNITHDVLWEYGFDEASGNFQVNNYGNGGLGGDDVQAEAQDGGGNCNANFGTPSDGNRPRMQMFLCTNASPRRDGSLDNGVIIHEYGHGVSNRLTGGPAAAGCLGNSEQMGEGWSDYLGLILTMQSGDVATDARGIGTYLFGQSASGPGIRPAPYSTDFGVNNFTYGDIPSQAIPHGVGFVWATMLWDMTWALIDDQGLGFNTDIYGDWTTGGNNLALQLVMDGMKNQPCNPGFVDGRDAILMSDDLLTGNGDPGSGENYCAIWDAFATRGLGVSADQGSSGSTGDGTEAFDLPAFCDTLGSTTPTVNICAGDTGSFTIGAGGSFAAPPVSFSTSGEPAGSTVTFDPVTVVTTPGTTTMDVATTGATPAAAYVITVTGTDTNPTMFDTMVTLNVFAGAPGAATLTTPADGATDVDVLPTFDWSDLADALSYTLEIDDDPAFGSIDYSVSGLTESEHTLTTELDYTSTYYWRVTAENSCGDGAVSAVFEFETAVFPGDCVPGLAPTVLFEDDLESGMGSWTSSGTGNTWALSGAQVNSGSFAFHADDPETESDQLLVSPSIVLPDSDGLTLQFFNRQEFETPNGDGRCWDAGILEISVNGGGTWEKVPNSAMLTDPYDNILWNDTPGNNPISNDYGATLAWCDPLQPFLASVVDLETWRGETAQFRWRLGSDSAAGGNGWYIDDVKVQACAAEIFSDTFESGDTSAWPVTIP